MRERGLNKTWMVEAMQTSRGQLNRLLDPSNMGAALHTLWRAAAVLGKGAEGRIGRTVTNTGFGGMSSGPPQVVVSARWPGVIAC